MNKEDLRKRKMNKEKINEILEAHKKWLDGKKDGKKAFFTHVDLCKFDFSGADLREADFEEEDLTGAKFAGADLRGANLYGSVLRSADFRGADLRGADLAMSVLCGANIRGAKITGARFRYATTYKTKMDKGVILKTED